MEDRENMPPIYVVTGGKGVAGHTIVETMLIQYPDNKIPIIMEPEVFTRERVEEITNNVVATNGAVVHTMVDHTMRKVVINACEEKGEVGSLRPTLPQEFRSIYDVLQRRRCVCRDCR